METKSRNSLVLSFIFLVFPANIYSKEVILEDVHYSTVIVGENNTISKNEIQLKDSGVELYIQPASGSSEIKSVFGEGHEITCLDYEEKPIKGKPFIFPVIGCYGFLYHRYLENYYLGREIIAQNNMTFRDIFPGKARLPILEARVINNTGRVISLKEITFDVFESKPYDKPFVIMLNYEISKVGYLYFVNEGNADIDHIEINYSVANNPNEVVSPPYKYHDKVSSPIENSDNFTLDLKETLKREGVDVDYLRSRDWFSETNLSDHKKNNLEKYLGKFIDKTVYIHGDLNVCGSYNFKKKCKSNPFQTKLTLTPYLHALGDIPVSKSGNDVVLKDSGVNYPVKIKLSSYIEPYSIEKYLFRIKSKLISSHKFNVKLTLSDNQVISSDTIRLFLYNSRSMRNGDVKWGGENEDSYFESSNLLVTGVHENDTLNIRDVYGVNGEIIGGIPHNGKGIEFRQKSIMENGSKWIYINYKGIYGWVNSKYIRK